MTTQHKQEQPVQEPYAWVLKSTGLFSIGPDRPFDDAAWQPLFTAPPDTTVVRQALDEWIEKTEWVQQTARFAELGMHRADVLTKRLTDTANALAEAHTTHWGKVRELETQHDELLKALNHINSAACYASEEATETREAMLLHIGEIARAAIAKAEGGAT